MTKKIVPLKRNPQTFKGFWSLSFPIPHWATARMKKKETSFNFPHWSQEGKNANWGLLSNHTLSEKKCSVWHNDYKKHTPKINLFSHSLLSSFIFLPTLPGWGGGGGWSRYPDLGSCIKYLRLQYVKNLSTYCS